MVTEANSTAATLIANDQLERLRQYFVKGAEECLHQPEGLLKHQYLTPTAKVDPGSDDHMDIPQRSRTGHYLQMYDWDACFLARTAAEHKIFDVRADVVRCFLGLQRDDGYIPRTISVHRIWDDGDLCKPFLCQTLLSKTDITDEMITEVLPGLHRYLDWLLKHRQHSSMLFCWRNVLESGVDNNLALLTPREAAKGQNLEVGGYEEQNILPVDLNCYLILEFRAFSELARRTGRDDLQKQFHDLANILQEKIETLLWNEDAGMYLNVHAFTNEPVEIKSWTGLLPVLLGLSDKERSKLVIEAKILNESQFWRPHGLPSTAASEKLYNNAVRGLYGQVIVSNWQGPMWILPNALTVHCLYAHGYVKQAKDLAERVARTVLAGIKGTGTTYENYHCESGQPLWAPQFISWNSMMMDIIDLLDGTLEKAALEAKRPGTGNP